MSLLVLKTFDGDAIPNGKLVVLVDDSGIWEARAFDEKTDSLSDVVGVTYTKNGNGRLTALPDGFLFNDKDYFLFNEDLSIDYNNTNPDYDGSFNPAYNEAYVYIVTNGMCAVEKIYTAVPSNFKKIKSGTNYDIYVII